MGKLDSRPPADRLTGPVLRLAPRPTLLAGREEMLSELDARLARSQGIGPRVVALCGLGGVGKTSVAVEYAHRHLAEVGLAWQFPAEDRRLRRPNSGSWQSSSVTGICSVRGTRWPPYTGPSPLIPGVGCWCLTMHLTRHRCERLCHRLGAGEC